MKLPGKGCREASQLNFSQKDYLPSDSATFITSSSESLLLVIEKVIPFSSQARVLLTPPGSHTPGCPRTVTSWISWRSIVSDADFLTVNIIDPRIRWEK
jgi:hypothetical protein